MGTFAQALGFLVGEISPAWIFQSPRICTIFLLTGLRIYTGEYKAQGPTLCPTEGRALRGPPGFVFACIDTQAS